MAGDGGRVPDVSEQRAEPGLAEEVAWAINCLRGIQGEINDLHRDGYLKAWDRSRLHDLTRCVVDGVQGRVGLERALRGEISSTAERSRSTLDRVRDARDDNEKQWTCDACEDTGIDRREGIPCGCGARPPQGEDHESNLPPRERAALRPSSLPVIRCCRRPRRTTAMPELGYVGVKGVWLRKIGDEVQVLAEGDDGWHLIISEPVDGNFSHIAEPAGILDAPRDPLEAK